MNVVSLRVDRLVLLVLLVLLVMLIDVLSVVLALFLGRVDGILFNKEVLRVCGNGGSCGAVPLFVFHHICALYKFEES